MSIKKRVIGASLATAMGLGLVVGDVVPLFNGNIGVVQAEVQEEGDFKYTNNGDGTVTVTEYKGEDRHLVIPSEIDGLKVTHIGSDFDKEGKVTKLTISDSVVEIGVRAFQNHKNLEEIDFSNANSLTEIGASSFSRVEKLVEIELPDSLEEIKTWAFLEAGLEKVSIGKGIKEIGKEAFEKNQLKEIEIKGKNVTYGKDVFIYNKIKNLEDIKLADGEELDLEIFKYNPIEITEEQFDYREVDGKIRVTGYNGVNEHLVIPKTIDGKQVKEIGAYFNKAYRVADVSVVLKSLEIPTGVEVIGEEAFDYNSITNIEIPESVREIGRAAFGSPKRDVEKITVRGEDTSIGSRAFETALRQDNGNVIMYAPKTSLAWTFGEGVGFTMREYIPKDDEGESGKPEVPEEIPGDGNEGSTGGSETDGDTSSSMDAGFNIGSGLFELETSKIKSFGNIEMPTEVTEYTTSFEAPFNVKDFSGKQLGWRVDVTASQFEIDIPDGKESYKLPVGILELSQLKDIKKVGNGEVKNPASKLRGKTFIDDGKVTVASANMGEGMGEYDLEFPEDALTLTLDPETVKIDVENYAGQKTPYKAKVSWDLVQAP